MRKWARAVHVVVLAMACLAFSACASKVGGKVTMGASEKFTEAEIQAAADCAKEAFALYEGCELIEMWYDEAKSDEAITRYTTVRDNAENVMVLFSDFEVDDSGVNPVLTPGTTYTDYMWIMVRDSETGEWTVVDRGY